VSVHVAPFSQGLLAHSSTSKTSKSERVGQRGGGRNTIMEVEMNTFLGESEFLILRWFPPNLGKRRSSSLELECLLQVTHLLSVWDILFPLT